MRPGARIGSILIAKACMLATAAAAADTDDLIISAFRNAIVKVDVSSPTPVIEGGRNLCVASGTGFLVSSSFVATAAHVIKVDARCGSPTIILRSKKHKVELLAKVAHSQGDIALLQVLDPFPQTMCALALMKSDVFDQHGVRFGIPGDFQDVVAHAVQIGAEHSGFEPLVLLNGAPTYEGESGAPVVVHFNVVGMLKSKHANYVGYSFMMVGSQIKSLMKAAKISMTDRKICNAAELEMATVENQLSNVKRSVTTMRSCLNVGGAQQCFEIPTFGPQPAQPGHMIEASRPVREKQGNELEMAASTPEDKLWNDFLLHLVEKDQYFLRFPRFPMQPPSR